MKKIIKIIVFIIGVVFICFIGRCAYMVACISCTTAPIRTYNYSESMDKLEHTFEKFQTSNPALNIKVSWREISNKYSARDVSIKTKIKSDSVEYDLVIYDFNGATKLDVDAVYDMTKKTGGNNIDSVATKNIFTDFQNGFLAKFKRDQKVTLSRDYFNF
jgi:hypothetical protein